MRHFSTTLLYHPRNRVVDPSTEVLLRVTDLAPGPQSGSARPLHSSAGPSYPAAGFIEPPRPDFTVPCMTLVAEGGAGTRDLASPNPCARPHSTSRPQCKTQNGRQPPPRPSATVSQAWAHWRLFAGPSGRVRVDGFVARCVLCRCSSPPRWFYGSGAASRGAEGSIIAFRLHGGPGP